MKANQLRKKNLIDPHKLKIFCALYEFQSFTQAARSLGLSQPSVSEHIQGLERYLRQTLFDRVGKTAVPTRAASLLHRHAVKILARLELAETEVRLMGQNEEGELCLGASSLPGGYILPALLQRFQQKYPKAQTKLLIQNSEQVTQSVAEGKVELGIVGYQAKRPGLIWQEWIEDELLLALPKGHPFKAQRQIGLQTLVSTPLILREEGSGTRKVFLEQLKKQKIRPQDLNTVAQLGSAEAVLSGIKQGLGLGIVSKSLAKSQPGLLITRPIAGLPLSRPLYLAQRKGRPLSHLAQLFKQDLLQAP